MANLKKQELEKLKSNVKREIAEISQQIIENPYEDLYKQHLKLVKKFKQALDYLEVAVDEFDEVFKEYQKFINENK